MKTTLLFLVTALTFVGASFAWADATTPTTTCQSLVEAAKAKDFKTIVAMTANYTVPHNTQGTMGNMATENRNFSKMHQAYWDKIKAISCGTEHVAGMHAFVEAQSMGETRFIPFIKTGDQWKFDAKTYMSFYPMPHAKTTQTN